MLLNLRNSIITAEYFITKSPNIYNKYPSTLRKAISKSMFQLSANNLRALCAFAVKL